MGKTYSTVHFPLSTVDPAGIGQGLIPNKEVRKTDSTGTIESVERTYVGIEAIKFNLRNVLLTIPDESPGDPDFGVGLSRYVFELETIDWSSLKGKVDQQITKYVLNEGYIKRFKTEFKMMAAQNALLVRISFVPSSSNDIESIETFDITVES
jgi:hypothetical protein